MGILKAGRQWQAQPVPAPLPQRPAPDTQKPDEEEETRRRNRVTVNLDTGAIVAATQLSNPWLRTALLAYLADKRLVATESVLAEFRAGSFNLAGPQEKALVAMFMPRVREIRDDPSARVMALRADSNTKKKVIGPVDRIAFGTGDKLGYKTITGDDKFVLEAKNQGVILDVLIHDPARYATK